MRPPFDSWGALARFVSAAAILLGLTGCSPRNETSRGVQLVLSPSTLEPTTTFEVRFEESMVTAAQAGDTPAASPLRIRPPIPGSYRWLSQRSGVFTPSEPPRLGTVYWLSLEPGLRRADGKRSSARLERFLRTPGLQLLAPRDTAFPRENAPAVPQVRLVFNAAVRASTAGPFMRFRSVNGGEVPAEVLQTKAAEFLGSGQPRWPSALAFLPLAWSQRFEAARHQGSTNPPDGLLLVPEPGGESTVAHSLNVLPLRPLPPGRDWELVIDPGLPSPEPGARLPAPLRLPIGNVIPFAVTNVTTDSGLNSGRRIHFEFSKPLPPDLPSSNLLEWITVTPAPSNLTAASGWQVVRLHGAFRLGERYAVTVRAGFPSAEGVALERDHPAHVGFAPLSPRLYFPDFTPDQLSHGRRELPLLALNTDRVTVRAKQIDPAALVHALRGFQSYFGAGYDRRREGEDYAAIDDNLIPGRTVFVREFVLSNRVDEPARVPLRWDDILGPGKQGALFVEAAHTMATSNGPARLGAQTLVQVTDLGLAWKHNATEALVYLFSHRTGRGIPGAQLRLVTSENEVLAAQPTDARGLARLAAPTNRAWILAETAGDVRAAELRENELPPYAFGLSWEDLARETPSDSRAWIFSDRPVYRLGETVHLKALLRVWRRGRLTVPEPGALRLTAFNARDQEFLQTNLTSSALGSIDLDVALPRVSQGSYRVELAWGETKFAHAFLVRDYRPNAFELRLAANPVYAASEPIAVGVAAQYLLGQPLTRASVDWSLDYADAGFAPEGFEAFAFCGVSETETDAWGKAQSVRGKGEYVSGTNFVIRTELPPRTQAPQPRQARLLVELTDLNQQSIAHQAEFRQDSSAFYLGIERGAAVLNAGAELPVNVVAVQADGRPTPAPVSAHVKLEHINWRTVRIETAGRVLGYRSEREVTTVGEREVTTRVPVKRDGKWVLEAPGEPSPAFVLEQAGQYRLEARTQDADGRAVASELDLYVSGRGELAWDYRNEAALELVPDAPRYQAGDTATILVKAPIPGDALVTVEREKVLRSWVVPLSGNAPQVRVPLEADDAPNVFVSVWLVRGSEDNPKQVKTPEHRLGYCRLAVEATESRLAVTVRPDTSEYRPGTPVHASAEVRDAHGQPVRGAEVTLFAVDEGVLSLTGFATPDPFAWFFQGEPLGVATGTSLTRLLPEDPSRLRFHNKGYLVGGGGQFQPRQDFRACAYWNGTLVTDAEGRVRAEFPAPDSLTRFRLMAVAHTTQSQFGRGEASFQINKPLMIEPAVPSFARLGDQLMARALVLNRTDRSGEVEIVFKLDETAVHEDRDGQGTAGATRERTTRVQIRPQAAVPVEFPVRFVKTGTSDWRWTARWQSGDPSAPGDADAVRTSVLVDYPAPLLREVHLARVAKGETNLLTAVNPQLLEGEGEATVRVAASRLGALGEVAARLVGYPYGCLEQTTSALLPWLVLDEAAASWLPATNRTAESARAIRHGIDRLFASQTYTGGLSYWPGETEPTAWGSAYAGLALARAQRRGVAMPGKAYEALLKYLHEQLSPSGPPRPGAAGLNDRCLIALTLAFAGRAEPAVHESLFDQRAKLSESARAWLASAVLEAGGPSHRAEELLRTRGAGLANDIDEFGCPASLAGARLLAWVRLHPEAPEVDVAVSELIASVRDGHWGSTQGNAWGLLALAEYARRVESGFAPTRGTVSVGGQTDSFDLSSPSQQFERTYPWPGPAPASQATLRHEGPSLLFVQTTVAAQPRVWNQPRQDRGYAVARAYLRLDDDNQPRATDSWRVGDRVLVTLTLETRQPAHYVVVDDPLPCVFEAVNPEFQSQATRSPAEGTEDWVSTRHELRADRAVFFCNRLGPGRYAIRYLARVRAAGTVVAPAAKVEEMYRPDRFGMSETATVRVRTD